MGISEPVQIQLIIVFGSIITAIVGVVGTLLLALMNRTRQHARVAAVQTQNSHESNLRDDLDEKFGGLASLVKGLVDDVSDVKADIGGVKKDVGGIKEDIRIIHRDAGEDRRALERERERIRELEQTRPPARKPRPLTKEKS